MESFFGHFKDEVDYKEEENLAELHTLVMGLYEPLQQHKKAMDIKKDDAGNLPESFNRSLRTTISLFMKLSTK